MCRDRLTSCGFYPSCLNFEDLGYHDLNVYQADLERRAPELFVADEASCSTEIHEYVKPAPDSPRNQAGERRGQDTSCESDNVCDGETPSGPHVISTIEGIRTALQKSLSRGSTRLFIIYRANSWSRMKITFDMFRLLCAFSCAPPRFLDLIRGMGYKSSPQDEHFMGCYCYLRPRSDPGSNIREAQTQRAESEFDICYNLRHFERHGRALQDPWSCRQSIIYQKYHFGARTSLWIIVQPSMWWKTAIDNAGIDPNKITHPLALHLRCICSTMSVTWDYLEYLSSKLLSLDQRASFPKPVKDFDFDFTLGQQAQALRKKLHHIKTILHGTTRIVEALSSHAAMMRELEHVPILSHQIFIEELNNITRDLLAHQSTTNELLNLSGDIKSTIESILSFQNQDLLNNNESHLRQIAEANSKETHFMSQIARWTYQDSRTMRIATLIAMVYLPANLVLTFFSTVFVAIDPQSNSAGVSDTEQAGSGGMVVHGQIWIAIISMVVLLLGTGGGFWLMDQRKKSSADIS